MTSPLTPTDCDLRDFPRMMIDVPRLRGSDFDATPDDAAWRAGFNLWLTAWHQVPAASLSADDATLAKAAGLGRDLRTWRKIKAIALQNWVECSDGRLYHPTVAEIALEAWLEKLARRLSSGAGNAKKHKFIFDPAPIEAEIETTSALLSALNPLSKALSKSSRRSSRCTPGALPAGEHREDVGSPGAVPPGSQGTEKGQGVIDSEASASDAGGVVLDIGRECWRLAVVLLVERDGLSEDGARKFFGGLLSKHGLEAKHLYPALARAASNGTADARGYLTQASANEAKRLGEPRLTTAEKALRSNIQ